jgi:hypothetical protein
MPEKIEKSLKNDSYWTVKFCLLFVFAAASLYAQTNMPPAQNPTASENIAVLQHVEELRARCIQERRIICGKIVKILPDGIIVDSGYTNLMRASLNQSWLIPGSVAAERATNYVESAAPDSVCLGQVYLTDLPKPPRGTKLNLFDYVVLDGFPMGKYTYTSVGTVEHTVRQFTTKVTTAVRWRYGQEIEEQEKTKPQPSN